MTAKLTDPTNQGRTLLLQGNEAVVEGALSMVKVTWVAVLP